MKILDNTRHNFKKGTLLFGNDIIVKDEEREIRITQPKYGETFESPDFNDFFAVLVSEVKNFENFRKHFKFSFKNRADLIYGLTLWSDLSWLLQSYFSRYIHGITFLKNKILINENKLTKEDLLGIVEILLVSIGYKSYNFKGNAVEEKEEKQPKNERIKKLLEKEKEVQEKLKAAKQQKSTESGGLKSDFEDYFIGLIYEFGLSLEDIYNMTGFALGWHMSYMHKVDIHKLEQIQFGNGTVGGKKGSKPKYNYFVDK